MSGPRDEAEGGAAEAGAGGGAPEGRARAIFRNYDELTGHGRSELRRDALGIAAAALAAVDPPAALRELLRLEGDTLLVGDVSFDLSGRRVFVIGAGKATIGMAAVLDEVLGERISGGAVVVKRGQKQPLQHMEVLEAAHPVPDAASHAGGLRLLEIARRASPKDLVLALVTGGSSALAVVPAEGISLADKIAVNRLLLASGADIVSINNVRKHISAIKGGFLAAACGCQIVNLTVSDVVGDPPDYFTDLTVPDRSTFAMAQAVCDRFDLWEKLPASVVERLRRADPAHETPKEIPGISTFVVASSRALCDAAAAEAARRGYDPSIVTLELEGEACEAGSWLADRLTQSAPGAALIAGGENTVTLGEATGAGGHGGPNQEAALAAALQLTRGPACVLCIDSDGTDGPTDAAGGLVDDLTCAGDAGGRPDSSETRRSGSANEAVTGHVAGVVLARHAAYEALAAASDLVLTGPTGTNVNDLKIALRPLAGS